jgi:hypothetical protein
MEMRPDADVQMTPSRILAGFVAGVLGVVVAHQAAVALIGAAFSLRVRAWSMAPVAPFGVPQVVSWSFWGGLWGIALAWTLARMDARSTWRCLAIGIAFGALLPSLAGWLVVAPIKEMPMFAGGDPVRIAFGLAVNGAWGLGTAALLAIAQRYARTAATPS